MVTGGRKEGKNEGKPETVRMPKKTDFFYGFEGGVSHPFHIFFNRKRQEQVKKSIFFLNRKRLAFNLICWAFLTYFWLFLF